MNIPESLSPAAELDRVAAALGWAVNRDDWWGPARVAFDAHVAQLRDRSSSLASVAREKP